MADRLGQTQEEQPPENDEEVITLKGVVKWFDPAKGYGFVVSDEGGPDILLHVNVCAISVRALSLTVRVSKS